jgi:hypothetical protein
VPIFWACACYPFEKQLKRTGLVSLSRLRLGHVGTVVDTGNASSINEVPSSPIEVGIIGVMRWPTHVEVNPLIAMLVVLIGVFGGDRSVIVFFVPPKFISLVIRSPFEPRWINER